MSDSILTPNQDAPSQTPPHGAHIIVFGNEKGGSGKSTAALHLAVALLHRGFTVATLDLDARQGTLSRYLQNRAARNQSYLKGLGIALPSPTHRGIERSAATDLTMARDEERSRLEAAIAELAPSHDFIIMDTPGSDTFLSRIGHSFADTLITPINDSFIDLDLLATVDPDDLSVIKPSIYAEAVWEQRKQRMIRDQGAIDWIVMRNRLGHTQARNKRDIERIVEKLARRIGFRIAPGFGERVIFRELFLKGLTLLDLKDDPDTPSLSMSHVAARQEVRALVSALNPDRLAKPSRAA